MQPTIVRESQSGENSGQLVYGWWNTSIPRVLDINNCFPQKKKKQKRKNHSPQKLLNIIFAKMSKSLYIFTLLLYC